MAKPLLEVVVVSGEGGICQKRQAPALEEQPVYKRLRMASPVCPMGWEASLPQVNQGFVASSLALPAVQSQSIQRCKKPPCSKVPYNPYDFTSDELDPAYEWPRESAPTRRCGVDVVLLLQHTLGQFPLGLRIDKLEAMVWKEHKVQLWKLSLEQGYWDTLKFLETVPGIRLKLRKGTTRCLVQLEDQTGGKASC